MIRLLYINVVDLVIKKQMAKIIYDKDFYNLKQYNILKEKKLNYSKYFKINLIL